MPGPVLSTSTPGVSGADDRDANVHSRLGCCGRPQSLCVCVALATDRWEPPGRLRVTAIRTDDRVARPLSPPAGPQ